MPAGEFLGIVSGTAGHKFTDFQNQPSRFCTFGSGYLFLSFLPMIINMLYHSPLLQPEVSADTSREFLPVMADIDQSGSP